MKLEAIVLAAGSGSHMVEITRHRPKCLLPVGGHSLIWFAITGLKSIGVSRIIVLVPENDDSCAHENEIKQYCHKEFKSFKDLALEFVTVPAEADRGTAESILNIKEKIRGDFIVHSCDTIVDPKALLSLKNHYRLYDPMLTILLSDDSRYFQPRTVPGRREKQQYTRDFIAIEPLDKLKLTANEGYTANKIVFIHSERDLKPNLRIKSRELALHPSLGVYSRFLDTHVYIFKRHIIDFMEENRDKAILKGEMIPFLVSKQFTRLNQRDSRDNLEDNDDDEILATTKQPDYEVELREKLANFNPRDAGRLTHFQKSPLPRPSACHALIVKDLVAYRVNTVGSFFDCNRDHKRILNVFGIKNRSVVKDCLFGDDTTVGEKCLIKKGSIGSNCKIGDKVKLLDCVIMDNVEIESYSNLTDCIVRSNSKIGAKCDLKSCIVGHRQTVPSGRKSNCEVIDDGHGIDLSDPIVGENE